MNKNRRLNGVHVLTPYGGATSFDDEDALRALGVHFESARSRDLRFFIDEKLLPQFESWFRSRKGRETNPIRELREELVDEEALLPSLEPAELDVSYVGLIEAESKTTRNSVSGVRTRYYFEIFDVTLPDHLWMHLLAKLDSPNSPARLIAIAEIESGRTNDGIPIAATLAYLLRVDERSMHDETSIPRTLRQNRDTGTSQ